MLCKSAKSLPNAGQATSQLVEGQMPQMIWQMCWPLLLTSLLTSLIGLSDLFIAGLSNNGSQAAVGIGEQILCLTILIGTGLATATTACVSRCVGAGQDGLARLYMRDSLIIGCVVGLVATVLAASFCEQIFTWLRTDAHVLKIGAHYLQISALGNLPFLLTMTLSAIGRAIGKPQYGLFMWAVITIISIAGSWCGVLFLGTQRTYCLDCLAISWDLGAFSGAILGFFLLGRYLIAERGGTALEQAGGVGIIRIKHLLQIGLPTVVADICSIISHIFMYGLLGSVEHAAEAQSAWSIGLKLEDTFASMPLLSLGLAVAAIVGQNLGAGKIERARQATAVLAVTGAVLMLVCAGLLCICAPALASAFTDSPQVLRLAVEFLRGSAIALPVLSVSLILFGGMEGAGSTKTVMLVNLFGALLIRVPLAWLLVSTIGLGFAGAWLALCLSRFLVSIAAVKSFTSSGWILKTISG